MNSSKKIVVGLSGGVDSAITALLLQQQGYSVTAIHMQNWETENDDPYCTATEDLIDAQAVCDHLNIELEVVNFRKEYWQRVFDFCLDEFNAGRTPNPDIYCNREIKFKCLLNYILASGASYLATGHYARIFHNQSLYQLAKGVDQNKDQSYFLSALGQRELAHCLFPLGEYTKSQVRAIAKEAKLPNYAKKDSTGLCFIGERNFKEFLREFLLAKPGKIMDEAGHVLGEHDGLMFYTIGQRKGLKLGGYALGVQAPWYVLRKDIKNNLLIVGQGHHHPALYNVSLRCKQLHWINGHIPSTPFNCRAKIRYRQSEQDCQIAPLTDDDYQVTFTQPQRAITPGQAIVFYQGDICLGSGIIQ